MRGGGCVMGQVNAQRKCVLTTHYAANKTVARWEGWYDFVVGRCLCKMCLMSQTQTHTNTHTQMHTHTKYTHKKIHTNTCTHAYSLVVRKDAKKVCARE